MQKSSSHSSGNGRPGSKNNFKKEGDGNNYSKGAKPSRKNYDGRSPSGGSFGEGKSTRSARPYSGRVADGDKPKRPFDKPAFRQDGAGERTDKPSRKPFDKPGRPGSGSQPFGERPKRTFDKPSFKKDDRDSAGRGSRKEFDRKGWQGRRDKPFDDRPKRPVEKPAFDKRADKSERANSPEHAVDKQKPFKDTRPFRDRPKPPGMRDADSKADRKGAENGKQLTGNTFSDVVKNVFNQPKTKQKEDHPGKRQQFEDQVYGELEDDAPEDRPKRPFEKKTPPGKKKHIHDHSEGRKKKYKDEDEDEEDDKEINQTNGPRLEMPLNKFIAHSGECSRRDAAELVKQGKVKVNGELVLDPGYRVKHDDKVTMSGKKLTPQKGMVYILLNKPKGFITTNDDPQGRKTVMQLVGNSGVDRLFPVGRLDRDTSGLLLITNDGDLTQKLCHPAYNIKKVYQVTLDKPLTKADFEKITAGVELEDGKANVDALSYLEKKNELGLEIHSGRNRIVRRIFESLGYVVDKLDRVMYAGLTKKNLPRSKWRYLDEREVILLKHFKS